MKTDLGDIAAELDAVAALLVIVGSPFQEDDNRTSGRTIGDALFGLQRYVERINEDVIRIESEEWEAKAKE